LCICSPNGWPRDGGAADSQMCNGFTPFLATA
jgi:hypothetical protein